MKKAIEKEFVYSGTIIIQTDNDGFINYVNKKFQEISGYEKNEILGKSISILQRPDMPDTILKKSYMSSIKNIRKNGDYYFVDSEMLVIEDDNKNITGYIIVQKPALKKGN